MNTQMQNQPLHISRTDAFLKREVNNENQFDLSDVRFTIPHEEKSEHQYRVFFSN
jgi:hypothetical protein